MANFLETLPRRSKAVSSKKTWEHQFSKERKAFNNEFSS